MTTPVDIDKLKEQVAREVPRMRQSADNWRRPSLAQVEGPNDLKIYGGTIAYDIDRWADMLENLSETATTALVAKAALTASNKGGRDGE